MNYPAVKLTSPRTTILANRRTCRCTVCRQAQFVIVMPEMFVSPISVVSSQKPIFIFNRRFLIGFYRHHKQVHYKMRVLALVYLPQFPKQNKRPIGAFICHHNKTILFSLSLIPIFVQAFIYFLSWWLHQCDQSKEVAIAINKPRTTNPKK